MHRVVGVNRVRERSARARYLPGRVVLGLRWLPRLALRYAYRTARVDRDYHKILLSICLTISPHTQICTLASRGACRLCVL